MIPPPNRPINDDSLETNADVIKPNNETDKPTQNTKSFLASNSFDESDTLKNTRTPRKDSLVPKGITIGLAIFALILSLAGYAFRIIFGEDASEVLKHALFIVPIFVLGIPSLFWIGSLIMNKLTDTKIQFRNAISLGLLTSCVTMLWLMGTYS